MNNEPVNEGLEIVNELKERLAHLDAMIGDLRKIANPVELKWQKRFRHFEGQRTTIRQHLLEIFEAVCPLFNGKMKMLAGPIEAVHQPKRGGLGKNGLLFIQDEDKRLTPGMEAVINGFKKEEK